MTNNNLEPQLIANKALFQVINAEHARATVYHALLSEFVHNYENAHQAVCGYCNQWHKPEYTRHLPSCLIARIERALAADADELRAILQEIAQS